MGRGAWRTTVHEATKSQTQLSMFTSMAIIKKDRQAKKCYVSLYKLIKFNMLIKTYLKVLALEL